MTWSDFSEKRVALLGAGQENISLLPYLNKAGAIVTIRQPEADPSLAGELNRLPNVKVEIGADWLADLDRFDFVFRTPSLPVATLKLALAGLAQPPLMTTPMNLFLSLGLGTTVGVTGTKGKGTTTTMLSTILKTAQRSVLLAGNIGFSVFDHLDQIEPDTVVVLELSSFQLEDLTISPQIALVLPITPDHLQPLSAKNPNYHSTMAEYALAKSQITHNQKPTDILIVASDNQLARQMAERSPAIVQTVSANGTAATYRIDSDGQLFSGTELVVDFSKVPLKGHHLWLDAALAVAAARQLGVKDSAVLTQGLAAFQPLPHRLEPVATLNGVRFIDDSYATAPEATIAALTAFTEPIILIAGGSSKGAPFDELASAIARSSVREVILIGLEAERLRAAIVEAKADLPLHLCATLEAAIGRAVETAQPGEVVLLSPACASKDMFASAEDRGRQFQERVHALGL